MKLTKRKDTAESKEYWAFVEKTAREVADWPDWKRGTVQESAGARNEEDSTSAAPAPRRTR